MNNNSLNGNDFEKKVFRLLENELKNNRLFIKPEYCKMYHKKGYYSKDRQSNIIVDISMEVFLPEAKEYSILIIIECKKYNHSVPVDDVEEFFTKLQQISGANIKGIIASSNSFQIGTLNFSESKGIGLLRILDDRNFKWVLKRAVTGLITFKEILNKESDIYNGLVTENYFNNQIDFLSLINNNYFYSAFQFFEFFLKDDICSISKDITEEITYKPPKIDLFVSFIKRETIEKYSQTILKNIKYSYGAVSIYDICEYLEFNDEIKIIYKDSLGTDELGFEIFGKITFAPTKIYISKKANENKNREKFTIAHEIGHHILNHMQYMTEEYYDENDFENKTLEIKIEDIKRIEWQANYFASSLLLPKDNIVQEFYKILAKEDIKDKGHGPLYIDHQECNIHNFYIVTNQLKQVFEVSRKAISIRLKDLKLLKDLTGEYA